MCFVDSGLLGTPSCQLWGQAHLGKPGCSTQQLCSLTPAQPALAAVTCGTTVAPYTSTNTLSSFSKTGLSYQCFPDSASLTSEVVFTKNKKKSHEEAFALMFATSSNTQRRRCFFHPLESLSGQVRLLETASVTQGLKGSSGQGSQFSLSAHQFSGHWSHPVSVDSDVFPIFTLGLHREGRLP